MLSSWGKRLLLCAAALLALQPAAHAGCGTTKVVKQAGGGDCATIQACVDLIPATLTGDFCIDIQDSATYAEEVTIAGKDTTAAYRILIGSTSAHRPVLDPPGGAVAALNVKNASVTLMGLSVVPSASVPIGVYVTSASAVLTNVLVEDQAELFQSAGVTIAADEATMTGSTVSISGSAVDGLVLRGSRWSTISFSSFTARTGSSIYLANNAAVWGSSNTITRSFIQGLRGVYIAGDNLGSVSHNTVSYSTINSTDFGITVYNYDLQARNNLFDSLVFSRGNGIMLDKNAVGNTVIRSTFSISAVGSYPLYLRGASSNTITQVRASNPAGYAIVLVNYLGLYSSYNRVDSSTFVAAGGARGVDISLSSSNLVTGCYVEGGQIHVGQSAYDNTIELSTVSVAILSGTAMSVTGSSNTLRGMLAMNPQGKALDLSGANNTIRSSTFTGRTFAQGSPNGQVTTMVWINGSGTTIEDSYIENICENGLWLVSSNNTVRRSTVAGVGTGCFSGYAAAVVSGASNTIVSSVLRNWQDNGNYGLIVTGQGNSLQSSTAAAYSQTALYLNRSSATTISSAYVAGGIWGALVVRGATSTVVEASVMTTPALLSSPVSVTEGSVNVSFTTVTVHSTASVAGLDIAENTIGAITVSSALIRGGGLLGLYVGTPSASATLYLSSVTFLDLASGATALRLGGGTVSRTFSDFAFHSPSLAVNVDASALGSGSSVLMTYARGSQAGPSLENDPNGVVAWLPPSGVPGVFTNGTGGGRWSQAATWFGGAVPSAGDPVTVLAHDAVTVDTDLAVSSGLTVSGTLAFSTTTTSSLRIVSGDLTVADGGTLTLGTPQWPMPAAQRARLFLASGTVAGAFGLTVSTAGNFVAYGATKTAAVTATADAPVGAVSVSVDDSELAGWAVGDEITIGMAASTNQSSPVSQTERRTITSLSGSNPLVIGFAQALAYHHYSSHTARVANLTRNVVISTTSGSVAYIRSLAQNATSFHVSYAEIVGMGFESGTLGSGPPKYGVSFDGPLTKAAVSSSTIRNGHIGLYFIYSQGVSVQGNVLYGHDDVGLLQTGTSGITVADNDIFDNAFYGALGQEGISSGTIRANYFYGNNRGAVRLVGASSMVVAGNDICCNYDGGNEGVSGIHLNGVDSLVFFNIIHANPSGIDVLNNNNQIIANTMSGGREHGILVSLASLNLLRSNVIYDYAHEGIWLNGTFNFVQDNLIYDLYDPFPWTPSDGGPFQTHGIRVQAGGNNVILNNAVSSATYAGIYLERTEKNLLAGNVLSYNYPRLGANTNPSAAVFIANASSNVLISETYFENNRAGVRSGLFADLQGLHPGDSPGNILADCRLGYGPDGSSRQDGQFSGSELDLFNGNFTLRNTKVNESVINSNGFDGANRFLLSLRHQQAAGEAQLYGQYTVAGTTWAIENAAALYPSTATAARLVHGVGHSASVTSTNDANALSQLIVVSRVASQWRVEGSSSGFLGVFTGSIVNQPFPAGSPQFNLTFTEGPAPIEEDAVAFGLLAGSRDAGTQKKLYIGDGDHGAPPIRSQLIVAPGAGFRLAGTAASPAVLDRAPGGGQFFGVVSSGAFTLSQSSVSNVDAWGLRFYGSAAVSLSSVSFDNAGDHHSTTSTYITAEDLTSAATFYGLSFYRSRQNHANYNVTVLGADGGLSWYFRGSSTPLSGEAYDRDPNDRVSWEVPADPPPVVMTPAGFTGAAVGISSIVWSWADGSNEQGYRVLSTLDANVSGDLPADTTSWADINHGANTAVTRRVAAFVLPTIATAAAVTRYTLADFPGSFAVDAAFISSITVSWSANTNPAGTTYRLDVSSSGAPTSFSTTSTQTTVTGLLADTAYTIALSAINGDGIAAPCLSSVSTRTLETPVSTTTIDAGGGTVTLDAPAGEVTATIPPNAFPQTVVVTLSVPDSFPSPYSPTASLLGTGVGIEITIDQGLQPRDFVILTVRYRPSDVAGLDPSKLILSRFDEARQVWVPLPSTVDTVNRIVTARTNHFSIFQIMQARPASSVGSAKAFPNPLRPSQGHIAMTFAQLPANARIRVYDLLGVLIKDLSADGVGLASWDGTNQSGAKVASGVYFVLAEGAGERKTFKVAVER